MDQLLFYPLGASASCAYASLYLRKLGFSLTDHPSPDVSHLLLDIPTFDTNGFLQDGSDLRELLRMLPKSVTLIGGNLNQAFLEDHQTIDLLHDPVFLAKNAAITAECALLAAGPHLKTTYSDSPALILGWGRIGKCIAQLLRSMGCPVTVAARKEQDRAILESLGYRAVNFSDVPHALTHCRILFNTVPSPPLHSSVLDEWKNGIAIDLASYPGMEASKVIPARGLPGKYAPDTTGKLIAETIIRLI